MPKNFKEVYNLELVETRKALETFYLLYFHVEKFHCVFFFHLTLANLLHDLKIRACILIYCQKFFKPKEN